MQNQGLTTLALQKFKQSFWGVFSFWFIIFLAFISIFAYVIAPDNSQFAKCIYQFTLNLQDLKLIYY